MPSAKPKVEPVAGDINPKLGELILHVAARSTSDPHFGPTDLDPSRRPALTTPGGGRGGRRGCVPGGWPGGARPGP